jgi:mono/diheme cytochrome c family protein
MKRSIVCAVSCVALMASAATSQSARAADADNGLRLAERWCASCLVVFRTQSKGGDGVPSFVAVAQRPGFNVEKLAFFLLDPHPVMPNMSLSRNEAQDIAAYIARIRK